MVAQMQQLIEVEENGGDFQIRDNLDFDLLKESKIKINFTKEIILALVKMILPYFIAIIITIIIIIFIIILICCIIRRKCCCMCCSLRSCSCRKTKQFRQEIQHEGPTEQVEIELQPISTVDIEEQPNQPKQFVFKSPVLEKLNLNKILNKTKTSTDN